MVVSALYYKFAFLAGTDKLLRVDGDLYGAKQRKILGENLLDAAKKRLNWGEVHLPAGQ